MRLSDISWFPESKPISKAAESSRSADRSLFYRWYTFPIYRSTARLSILVRGNTQAYLVSFQKIGRGNYMVM